MSVPLIRGTWTIPANGCILFPLSRLLPHSLFPPINVLLCSFPFPFPLLTPFSLRVLEESRTSEHTPSLVWKEALHTCAK